MRKCNFHLVLALILTVSSFTEAIAQKSVRAKDSIHYNHYLKTNLLGTIANIQQPSSFYLSLQYEGLLKPHQTYGLAMDYKKTWETYYEVWLRPQWRYYFGESFRGFYAGTFLTYVHTSSAYSTYESTGDYGGLGAMAGFQLIASRRFLLELNIRYSRQFGNVRGNYDYYTGQPYSISNQFNMGTVELNLGFGVGKKRGKR